MGIFTRLRIWWAARQINRPYRDWWDKKDLIFWECMVNATRGDAKPFIYHSMYKGKEDGRA